jgi:ATP-dependent DNA helicase RecG
LETKLQGILGDRTQKALQKAFGYVTVGDLLQHYPRRYASRGELTSIAGVPLGEQVTLVAEVVSAKQRPMRHKRGSVLEVVISDGTGLVTLTFFNQAWRQKDLVPGARGMFAGKVGAYRGERQLTHPDYELFTDEDALAHNSEEWAKRPIPLYPATSSLASWQIAKSLGIVLDVLDDLADPLPESIRSSEGLLGFRDALEKIHRPTQESDWKSARKTLRFHEALVLQTALVRRRLRNQSVHSTPRTPGEMTNSFLKGLPFTLTEDQLRVVEEIHDDMTSGHPMNRLVQGEVGSGKTVVAATAMVTVAGGGGQTALLAPTEVLANQHFRSLIQTLGPDMAAQLNPVLLTGALGATERKKALLAAASGASHLVVGTHALLGESVQFADLGLVVIDEQHRFGVDQRDALRHKGSHPHVLVLTATPIPRTVAMTVFGDLDVSTIAVLPQGRSPIESHVVALADHPTWYPRVWSRIAEEVAGGRQAFVVTSAISASVQEEGELGEGEPAEEESEGTPTVPRASVEETLPMIRALPEFAALRVEAIHGRMPTAEKDEVMQAFAAGNIDVLVATTVIEVGIDVPNASIMVILDADRFGVSQLHQLRGRVGRGGHKGTCLLVTHAEEGSTARARVEAVASTLDGFELAAKDLELRREGDVLGASQSGRRSSLRLVRVTSDGELIDRARDFAEAILASDPDLSGHPELLATIEARLDESSEDYLEKN